MKHEIRLPASCCHGDQYEDYGLVFKAKMFLRCSVVFFSVVFFLSSESIRAEKHDQALHVPYEVKFLFSRHRYCVESIYWFLWGLKKLFEKELTSTLTRRCIYWYKTEVIDVNSRCPLSRGWFESPKYVQYGLNRVIRGYIYWVKHEENIYL